MKILVYCFKENLIVFILFCVNFYLFIRVIMNYCDFLFWWKLGFLRKLFLNGEKVKEVFFILVLVCFFYICVYMFGKFFGILKVNLDLIFFCVCFVLKKWKCYRWYDYKVVGFIVFVSFYFFVCVIIEG